jgi:exopolysaccharide biosynthesis protein
MRARNFSIVLLLALAARASGEWSIVSSDEISSTAAGGRHIRTIIEEKESGDRVQLHFALFDLAKATLRVIDQPNELRRTLEIMMSKNSCIAGVNGGYFDPDYKPVGLLISDGKLIAPLRKARLLSGVLSVAKGRVRLQRVSEFSMKGKITEALQCGPFLVDHGHAVAGLDDSRSAQRTFVATGNGDRVALGFCSDVSLAQLSRILSSGKIAGDHLEIERALNLDGGSSSAFWFRDGDEPFSIPEQKTVRDFVGIVAK